MGAHETIAAGTHAPERPQGSDLALCAAPCAHADRLGHAGLAPRSRGGRARARPKPPALDAHREPRTPGAQVPRLAHRDDRDLPAAYARARKKQLLQTGAAQRLVAGPAGDRPRHFAAAAGRSRVPATPLTQGSAVRQPNVNSRSPAAAAAQLVSGRVRGIAAPAHRSSGGQLGDRPGPTAPRALAYAGECGAVRAHPAPGPHLGQLRLPAAVGAHRHVHRVAGGVQMT